MTRQPRSWLPQRRQWGLLLFAVFIGDLFVEPYRHGAGALEWTLTMLGTAVFLGLFSLAFVLRSRQLLWIVAVDTVLGILFAPFNAAAATKRLGDLGAKVERAEPSGELSFSDPDGIRLEAVARSA